MSLLFLEYSKRVYQGVRVKHTVKDLLAEKRSRQTTGPRFAVSLTSDITGDEAKQKFSPDHSSHGSSSLLHANSRLKQLVWLSGNITHGFALLFVHGIIVVF